METLNRLLAEAVKEHFQEEKKLVFGEGRMNPVLMLIGEAPGEQETLAGRPFVGKAGKNLNEFLEAVGLVREEMYVSNTVKYRPSKLSKAGRIVNRPPTKQEVAFFAPWLIREITIVAPKIIVTLGNTPLQALTDSKTVIGDVHGRNLETNYGRIYPLYHPASMIYNPSLRAVYAEDLRNLTDQIRING